jgi:oligopeptide/dipeptide ABC transporter ATP-binding protein
VLIADEPTTALDVTVQAQIFDLLQDLQKETGTAIILITHDMGAIAEMAERVIVMYAGRKVEDGPVGEILGRPLHPYTKGLIRCVPHLEAEPSAERHDLEEIPGVVPGLTQLGRPGCPFAPRCSERMDACAEMPAESGAAGHRVSCWAAPGGAAA